MKMPSLKEDKRYLFFFLFLLNSLLGVPIAYDNIKVVGELGDIYDDQGYVHLNIEADFVIFCPEPGQKLMVCISLFSLAFFVLCNLENFKRLYSWDSNGLLLWVTKNYFK